MKCYLRRTADGLAADDEFGEAALRGIKVGEFVRVEVVRERNAKHHRLFWAMCGKLGAALDIRPKVIADALKLRTGHYTEVQTQDGELLRVPDSISWAAMDQQSFRKFFDDCCREICTGWLPHMSPSKWRREVLQMMGIDWPEEGEGDADEALDPGRSRGNAAPPGRRPH